MKNIKIKISLCEKISCKCNKINRRTLASQTQLILFSIKINESKISFFTY